MTRFGPLLLLLALPACQFEASDDRTAGNGAKASLTINATDDPANASIAISDNRVTIDTSALKANIRMPAIKISNADMDIDGMALYPGTTITGMDLSGDGADHPRGHVRMTMRSDDAPAGIIAYYQRAAAGAGYRVAAPSSADGDTTLVATKGADKAVHIALRPDGAGTSGVITISGE